MVSKSGDKSAYMARRTRGLEDLVARERTDEKGATTKGCQRRRWGMPTPTHWAVGPSLLPSASWLRACEEL